MKKFYEILGLKETATVDEIKKAYKKKAAKYHPDKQINKTEQEKAKNEEKFKEIKNAYEILTDPEKQKEYKAQQYGGYDFSGFNQGQGFSKEDFTRNFDTNFEAVFEDLRNFKSFNERAKAKDDPFESNPLFQDFIKNRRAEGGVYKIKQKLNALGFDLAQREDGSYFVTGEIKVDFQYMYQGLSLEIGLPIFNDNGDVVEVKKFNIKVKPKTKNKTKMKLAGKGPVVKGLATDVILTLKIKESGNFSDGKLSETVKIDLFDVLTKSTKEFSILDKKYKIDLSKQDLTKKSLLPYSDMDIKVLVSFVVDYSVLNKFDETIISQMKEIQAKIK